MGFKVIGYAHAQITGAMIIVEKKQKYVVIRNLIGCICAIGFNLLMIPSFGAIGAAISSVVTSACTGIFSHLIIPLYRPFFKKQIYSFVYGWKDLTRICTLKKHNIV
jgi:O-antigen/teichoic acid export membrane protein